MFFFEYLFFDKKMYNHQYLSFFCFLFILIFKFIFNSIEIGFLKILIDFCFYIIYYFFVGFKLVLIKYLIDYFYMNGYVLLGIQGIYNLIFYIFFYFFSFGIEDNIFKKIYWILFLIPTFFNFIINIFTIIILTNFGPIFYSLSCILFEQFLDIVHDTINHYFFRDSFINIISCFLILVYCEIIQLNFCGLNKNTRKNIQIRERIEYSIN